MTQPRQPGGIPVGGQFAAKAHTEATTVALADELPRPSDIDDALYREVGKILSEGDGVTTENVIDLMDHDEDQFVAAFGQGPTDWLCGLTVRVEAASRQTYRGGLTEPDEWAYGGYVTVEDAEGNTVAEVPWNGEDDPELPALLRRCPVDAAGRPLSDHADPGWKQVGTGTGTVRSSEWRRCGFHTPDAALAWRRAGFAPEAASEWDEAGFTPDEAREHRSAGIGVGTAMYQRTKDAEAADSVAASAPAPGPVAAA